MAIGISQNLPQEAFGKFKGTQDKFVYEVDNMPKEMPQSEWEMVISTTGVDFTQKSVYGNFVYSGNYIVTDGKEGKNITANVKHEQSKGLYNFELSMLFKESDPYWVMKTADKIPEIILLKVKEEMDFHDVTTSEEGLTSGESPHHGGGGEVFAFCHSCGFPNKNKFVFCPRCGSDLKLDATTSIPPSEDEDSAPVTELESSMVDTPIEAQQTDDIPIEIGKLIQPPKIDGQYTIQVASKPTIHEARGVQDDLIDNGFNSYLQEVNFSDNNDIWYRIRVGKYRKKDRAVTTRDKVASIYGEDVWVDNVRLDIE